MLARKVLHLPAKLPRDCQGTLAFQEPNHRGDRILGRDLYTPMDRVRQEMPRHDPTLLLSGQLVKDRAQTLTDLSVEGFATILRNEHHLRLAFPARVCQALPGCFWPTVLRRVGPANHPGGLYSRNAQSCSSLTSRT